MRRNSNYAIGYTVKYLFATTLTSLNSEFLKNGFRSSTNSSTVRDFKKGRALTHRQKTKRPDIPFGLGTRDLPRISGLTLEARRGGMQLGEYRAG